MPRSGSVSRVCSCAPRARAATRLRGPTKGPSLRGPKAWALLRTLAEVPPPLGVRELAEAVDVDAGYVSRLFAVLEDELLVTRTPRGPVTGVEWEGVLRRCDIDLFAVFDSNVTSTWVATGGPSDLLADLAGKRAGRWAITGSFAAARVAPVAAPEDGRHLHRRRRAPRRTLGGCCPPPAARTSSLARAVRRDRLRSNRDDPTAATPTCP